MRKLMLIFATVLISSLNFSSLLWAQQADSTQQIFLPLVTNQSAPVQSALTPADSEEETLQEVMAAASWTDAPANPNAAATTRQLLAWLQQPPNGCHLIAGQDIQMFENVDQNYADLIEGLERATGRWVGILGADYNSWGGSTDWRNTNRILIDYWRQGGLVELSWTANNPWTGGDAWDLRQADLRQLLTPGTPLYRQWVAKLDHIAAGLAELQQAGVVVLWRPFHELNGDWFWWGMTSHPRDPQPMQALWQHMFNYFTYTKGLNNLLWVYSVSGYASTDTTRRPVDFYYPGSDFVDIVGQDIYEAAMTDLAYEELLTLGKPFALTEFGPGIQAGPLTDGSYDYLSMLDLVMRRYPETIYWLSWSDWDEGNQRVNISIRHNRNARPLMNHQCVITRDEIDWRATPPATPTPVATPLATPTPPPGGNDQELAIVRVTKAPKIDGKIDAVWAQAVAAPLTHFVLGNPVAATDLSATVRALYDRKNLYLLVEVNDDITRRSATQDWWENDGIELYIDSDRSAGATYDGINDFLLALRWKDKQVHLGNDSAPMPKGKFKFVKAPQGHRLEISLSLVSLGIAATAGTTFGLDVHVSDDDGNLRESKIAWHSTIDDAWLHPSSFGVGRLLP